MKQLHIRDTFNPKHYIYLNEYQKKSTPESHIFIKEKIDSKIKGKSWQGETSKWNPSTKKILVHQLYKPKLCYCPVS